MGAGSVHVSPDGSGAPRAFCRGCGYALVGLAGAVCPECGRTFDLSDARSFARRPPRGWMGRWLKRLVFATLIPVVAAAGPVGWLWWGWHSEQAAIAQLRTLGADVNAEPVGPAWLGRALGGRWEAIRWRATYVSLRRGSPAEVAAIDFAALGHLDQLLLTHVTVGDATLARVGRLAGLRQLNLASSWLEGDGLAHLAGLSGLERLYLGGPNIDDAALARLPSLPRLKGLVLAGTLVTDAGLSHLRHLRALAELGLWNTDIGDAGLGRLADVPSLRRLKLDATAATTAGIRRLIRARPGVTVEDGLTRLGG